MKSFTNIIHKIPDFKERDFKYSVFIVVITDRVTSIINLNEIHTYVSLNFVIKCNPSNEYKLAGCHVPEDSITIWEDGCNHHNHSIMSLLYSWQNYSHLRRQLDFFMVQSLQELTVLLHRYTNFNNAEALSHKFAQMSGVKFQGGSPC